MGFFDSDNGVHIVRKIVLEIALDGYANPLKKNERAGVRSRELDGSSTPKGRWFDEEGVL